MRTRRLVAWWTGEAEVEVQALCGAAGRVPEHTVPAARVRPFFRSRVATRRPS
jgi:hypothetical protein